MRTMFLLFTRLALLALLVGCKDQAAPAPVPQLPTQERRPEGVANEPPKDDQVAGDTPANQPPASPTAATAPANKDSASNQAIRTNDASPEAKARADADEESKHKALVEQAKRDRKAAAEAAENVFEQEESGELDSVLRGEKLKGDKLR
ncbi:MAG: hypothetical protein QM778_28770 [Myxococcales bacterium]